MSSAFDANRAVLARAIAQLQSLEGRQDELAELAQRLAAELRTPAPAPGSASWSRRGLRVLRAHGARCVVAAVVAGVMALATIPSKPAQRASPAATEAVCQPQPEAAPGARAEVGAVSAQPPLAAAPALPLQTSVAARSAKKRPPSKAGPPSKAPTESSQLPTSGAAPEQELSLVSAAQAALDTRPLQALALAERHAREYPAGLFAEEREIIALEAELKLRRTAAASGRAQRFLQRFEHSAHARSVQALIATHVR